MSRNEGLSLLEGVSEKFPHTKVVIMTGEGDPKTAQDCIGKGAADFIEKPVETNKIAVVVERVLRHRALEQAYLAQKTAKTRMSGIIGSSGAMQAVYGKIRRAASSEGNVLLLGEPGTGKKLVARTIHSLSERKNQPLIEINCAGFEENRIETELFGHVRSAFPGALEDKKGLFEAADKGTLLLDEIGVLSRGLQAKLLHVLEEKQIQRVGASESIRVDVRILAVTNMDIRARSHSGHFQKDLYRRLKEIEIVIPSLRERKGDITLLADSFFECFNNGRLKWMGDECYDVLRAYPWPGNVRELKAVIKEVLMDAIPGRALTGDLFALRLMGKVEGISKSPSLEERVEAYDTQEIADALQPRTGRMERIARYLGVTRQGLWKRLRRIRMHP
jgi:DNA-binding NtrC family response regulator